MNSRTTGTRIAARRVFALAVLAKLLPEVRTYKPEGARAQLVMAVAEKFEALS